MYENPFSIDYRLSSCKGSSSTIHNDKMASSVSLDAKSLFEVNGLVAVITGGGSGLGLMMAQALEANGAIVYIIGRRKESLEKAAATAKHGNIRHIVGDVTSKPSLEAAASNISSETGGIVNLVIANSGISGPGMTGLPPNPDLATYTAHLASWKTEDINATLTTNVTGVFNTVVAFLHLLDAGNKKGGFKQRSQVIAISSIGAFNRRPLAGYAYSSSKAAVVHLMKSFATTLVPYNIRSNVICPGLYPSELTTNIMSAIKSFTKDQYPEERPGDVEDMAGAILFLASKAGSYMNGNVLVTDGGRLAVMNASY
ncbi:NAD(P)-binding protein [Xylariaceae sp. FL0255]|nr:NAD(P)-binding protein [Xylariaceae sp. FL0255]